jgi:hypothetical protein
VDDVTPWLCQGDVFQLLPQIVATFDPPGDSVRSEIDVGPSLLMTHGCDLDKPTSKGQPRIERLQFLPLRDLNRQTPDRQRLARARSVAPPEVVYVGQVDGVGDAFGLLSEMYALPSVYFQLALIEFADDPRAEPGKGHLVAGRHGTRMGRLPTEDIDLLHRKVAAFWPRFDARPPDVDEPPVDAGNTPA